VSIQERLTQFLKESADWERKTTSVPGIFLLKLPSSKTGTGRKEALAIEINPINPATSSPTKKRGNSNKVSRRARTNYRDTYRPKDIRAS
jgi:hypothetical protein